ncbi:TPA: hypothetical protein DCZ39_03260 [Patescibacteria group bacterium]|nr:hypothetical protein [Candidatus Gracilibacteria bacterium]
MVHRPAENHHQPRKPQKSNKKTADISQKGEKEIFQELHTYGDVYLLNKPNMTPKDKENMEKSIKFLADYKMNTLENLQKLDAIIYTKDYIEIGGVKRARKNLQTEENGKDIFKHEDEVYFTFDALKKQKKLLDKQGMKIP